MCGTLDHIMSKKIWVEAFEKYLQRRFYQADDAGISFRIYGHQHGLTIHTTGFSEKQLHLCIEIINCMIAFRLNENEFMQVKDAIIKRLTNRLLQKPVNQMFASLNTLIQGDTYSISQQVAAVRKLQFSQLDTHQIEFFHQVGVEALMAGNWRLYAAQRMHQQLQSRLTARGVWQKPIIVAKAVDQACLPTLPKITARDTAVVLYQQVRKLEDDFLYVTEHATAICLVLENILSPYIFLRLRNDKQLAYLVGVGYKPINMQPGIAIYVQSSKASAGVIYHAVQQVITELLENWQQTELDVEQIKPRIIEQCKPMDRDVSSIARRLWANFEHLDPYYHYQNLQKAVERLPAAEIKRWLIKLRHANEGQILLTNDTDALEQEELLAFTHNPTVN
jgi:secreted Zn-dependent insulinase-like peptidase